MKLPSAARKLTRRTMGMGRATAIAPEALRELSEREDVLVIGVGMMRDGAIDERLPGEQRTASLISLASVVDGVAHDRPIVLHCG